MLKLTVLRNNAAFCFARGRLLAVLQLLYIAAMFIVRPTACHTQQTVARAFWQYSAVSCGDDVCPSMTYP